MHSLEIKAVRSLRGKIFANMAVIESFCGHMRRVLADSHAVEEMKLSDRELAQMVQQWLSIGDVPAGENVAQWSTEDVDASFAVLEQSCDRLLGPDFTLEERQALTSLGHYLKRRITAARPDLQQFPDAIPTGRTVIQKGFMSRFWHALNSA